MSSYLSPPSSYQKSSFGLYVAATAMVVAAAGLWSWRSQRAMEANFQARNRMEQHQAQRAAALLYRSLWAENNLRYSAVSTTTTIVGTKPLTVRAAITRAPNQLAVKFLSGDAHGVTAGYSDRWFWRQGKATPMMAYAEVREDAAKMAERRFALMVKNYAVKLAEPEIVAGRKAEVVEVRPWQPCTGAKGPARRIFIDADTGLTLGVDSFNHILLPVMQTRMAEVNLRPEISERTFARPRAILAAANVRNWSAEEMGRSDDQFNEVVQKSGIQPPRPTYIPAGFELDGYALQRCRQIPDRYAAALTRYTDGLNTLTIFAVNPKPGDQPELKACDFGPGNLASRKDGKGFLVALADLPLTVLEKVLNSASFELANLHSTGTEPRR